MPIIELPGLQLQAIEVGGVEIQMPYQDGLAFAPAAYQADAIETIMDTADSDVVLHY